MTNVDGRADESGSALAAAQWQIAQRQATASREAVAAQALIDDFVAEARRRGIEPAPLRAQLIGGGTARTDQRGWYIKANQSVAISEDGAYLLLVVAGGLMERLRGVTIKPTLPPLEVSKGGRDGETGPLADFLQRRLAQAD
jgi:hypothetical protein